MRRLRPRPGSRIAVDRATSRCPAIPLSRGRSTSNRNPTCSDWQKGGFSRHAEIFSGTTSSIAVAHAINTNADEHGPPAPVVPPLVSGRLILGGLLLSRARLHFAGLPL